MVLASLFSLIMALLLLKWWGVALLAMLCLVLLMLSRYLCSRFGGLTGDSYGAIDEFGEVSVLILAFIVAELGGVAWLPL